MLGRIVNVILFSLAVVLLTAALSAAQAPTTISYQGRLTDDAGQPISSTSSVTFAVYAAPTGGSPLFTTTQNITPDANGIFTVELGPIGAAVFDGSKRYLGIKVGADAEMTPRQLLTSGPYSFSANSIADNAVGSAQIANGSVTAADIAAGAVANSELATNAVTTDKIASGAVANADIASNAVNGAKVADGSLTDADMADEPGLTYAETGDGNTLVDLTGTGKVFTSVTLNAPTSGYALVTAVGIAFVTHTLGTFDNVIMKVSRTSGDVGTPSFATALVRVPDDWPSSTQRYCETFTITHMFPVSAGNNTFYLNGYESSGTGNDDILAPRIMAVFIPSLYGSAPAPVIDPGNKPDLFTVPSASSDQ